ncbi:hypothetical protein MTR67_001601, partial [Solanum verrucosum]
THLLEIMMWISRRNLGVMQILEFTQHYPGLATLKSTEKDYEKLCDLQNAADS